ncbi:uncharacterized protein BO66DRAFT_317093, partial [Aspergillus aculeatinus CBS 121060]
PWKEYSQNNADRLEDELRGDGFTIWGFVIYRCTYGSDAGWERFMSRLLFHIPEKLKPFGGLDLLDTFRPTVLQDPSFDGASPAYLREHFEKWAAAAAREEHGMTLENARIRTTSRYRFFIQVHQEALESVLSAPDPTDPESSLNKTGFVRLVNSEWDPEEQNSADDTDYPPMEGCTLPNVGWMNLLYDDAELNAFYELNNFHWDDYYKHPPAIIDLASFGRVCGKTRDGEGETRG